MIKIISFKKGPNDFQTQLQNDIKYINNSDKIFLPSDKSRNGFVIDKTEYKNLSTENIIKTKPSFQKVNLTKKFLLCNIAHILMNLKKNEDCITT